jgi:protoporphyrinogen oxidase
LPYRDFITVGLLLDQLKIKNQTKIKTLNNIVPDNWIYVQEREVKMGRIQIFNNWSPYMLEDPKHKVWMGLEYFCTEGDEMWEASDEDFIAFATKELVSMGIIESESDVLDACRLRVKKAYPAYFGSYDEFPVVREYLDTIPNLYCIGRNGQHRYNNMDHSMLTAMVAVNGLLEGKTDKSALWEVNTEKAYHEEKEEKK